MNIDPHSSIAAPSSSIATVAVIGYSFTKPNLRGCETGLDVKVVKLYLIYRITCLLGIWFVNSDDSLICAR